MHKVAHICTYKTSDQCVSRSLYLDIKHPIKTWQRTARDTSGSGNSRQLRHIASVSLGCPTDLCVTLCGLPRSLCSLLTYWCSPSVVLKDSVGFHSLITNKFRCNAWPERAIIKNKHSLEVWVVPRGQKNSCTILWFLNLLHRFKYKKNTVYQDILTWIISEGCKIYSFFNSKYSWCDYRYLHVNNEALILGDGVIVR